jgi:hypothetical protein
MTPECFSPAQSTLLPVDTWGSSPEPLSCRTILLNPFREIGLGTTVSGSSLGRFFISLPTSKILAVGQSEPRAN